MSDAHPCKGRVILQSGGDLAMLRLDVELDEVLPEQAAKELADLAHYLDKDICGVRCTGTTLTLVYKESISASTEQLADDARKLARSLNAESSKDFTEILRSSGHEPQFTANPWAQLIRAGLVREVEPGICYLSGELCELADRMDELVKDYATSLGAVAQSYASILPFQSLVRNGYLSSFPQHAFFVASAHQSLQALETISRIESGGNSMDARLTGAPSHMLAPTVCYHTFESLRGTVIDTPALFSARAQCHRNERASDTLLRLKTFSMREIVFFGSAEIVHATRHAILERCGSWFESWGLKYRTVTACDPFFTSGAEQRRVFQKVARSKVEIQAYIPYCARWVAVASFNDHSSTLTTKYAMGPEGLCSGCFGIGYERLVYSLICQLGCDVKEIMRRVFQKK